MKYLSPLIFAICTLVVAYILPAASQTCNTNSSWLTQYSTITIGDSAVFGQLCGQLQDSGRNPTNDFNNLQAQINAIGGPKLLNTVTANNTSGNLTDTTSFTAAYTRYQIVLENVVAAVGNTTCEFLLQSGGSFQITGYLQALGVFVSAGANTLTNVTTFIPCSIATDLSNSTTTGISGIFFLMDPSNTINSKDIYGTFSYFSTGGLLKIGSMNGIFSTNASPVTGIQLANSGGNWVSGRMKIYGIP